MSSGHSIEQWLTDETKAEALRLGFFRCGVTEAVPVCQDASSRLAEWLKESHNAGMEYMARNTDVRLDPRLLLPGAQSIVCVALSYAPAKAMPPEEYTIAAYALGRDYHDAMKVRLRKLAAFIERMFATEEAAASLPPIATRTCCDTAPVLERHWAMRAGLGWIGRNTMLTIPDAGSMFFLGEILVNRKLAYDAPIAPRCGNCHACIDACPTHALSATHGLDARKCLSYLTIENRGPIPPEAARVMGNCIYGCDRCQMACPWNSHPPTADAPELLPSAELLQMRKADWHRLSPDTYRRLFKGSAVKRAKYDGLMRNIAAAQANSKKEEVENQTDVEATEA